MSDDEFVDEEVAEINEGADLLNLRTLVHLVQQVPPLYDKKMKEYCGKKFDKTKGWNDVGRALVPPMTGIDAQKEFYKIRQRFGKELRAYRKSCVGKSGQGNKGHYSSKWPLYDDCLFLADIITPKKTSSSYTSVPKAMTTVPIPIPNQLPPRKTATLAPSPTPSAAWSSDEDLFGDGESFEESTSGFITSSESAEESTSGSRAGA